MFSVTVRRGCLFRNNQIVCITGVFAFLLVLLSACLVSCISLSPLQTVLHNWQVSFTAHDVLHASIAVSVSIFLFPSCSWSFCVLADTKETVFLFSFIVLCNKSVPLLHVCWLSVFSSFRWLPCAHTAGHYWSPDDGGSRESSLDLPLAASYRPAAQGRLSSHMATAVHGYDLELSPWWFFLTVAVIVTWGQQGGCRCIGQSSAENRWAAQLHLLHDVWNAAGARAERGREGQENWQSSLLKCYPVLFLPVSLTDEA